MHKNIKKVTKSNVPNLVKELTMKFYNNGRTSLLTARRRAWRKYNYIQAVNAERPELNKAVHL